LDALKAEKTTVTPKTKRLRTLSFWKIESRIDDCAGTDRASSVDRRFVRQIHICADRRAYGQFRRFDFASNARNFQSVQRNEIEFVPDKPFEFGKKYSISILQVETKEGIIKSKSGSPAVLSFKTPEFKALDAELRYFDEKKRLA
jgi:hypothetical protein